MDRVRRFKGHSSNSSAVAGRGKTCPSVCSRRSDPKSYPDRLILPTEPPECPALFQLASQCFGVTVFGSRRVAPGTLLRRSPPPHRFLKTFGCPTGYLMNVNPRLRPHTDCDRQKKCE